MFTAAVALTMPGPDSPCTGTCRLDAVGTCVGCGRRMDEIAEWPSASPQRQHEILAAARERLSIIRPTPPREPGA